MLRLVAFLLALYAPRPDFQAVVHYWQHELALEDWNVSVQLVSATDLDDKTLGDIAPNLETKSAVIRILREQDYHLPIRSARADQRLTVAHEMVHLKRFVYPEPVSWTDEGATDRETFEVLQQHSRWRELSVLER